MRRFLIFIYIFLEVGEQYDGTNITKLSHYDGNFFNQLINQLINNLQNQVLRRQFLLSNNKQHTYWYHRSKYDRYES